MTAEIAIISACLPTSFPVPRANIVGPRVRALVDDEVFWVKMELHNEISALLQEWKKASRNGEPGDMKPL